MLRRSQLRENVRAGSGSPPRSARTRVPLVELGADGVGHGRDGAGRRAGRAPPDRAACNAASFVMKSRAVDSRSASSAIRENQFSPVTRSDSIAWCTGCTPSTRGTGTGAVLQSEVDGRLAVQRPRILGARRIGAVVAQETRRDRRRPAVPGRRTRLPCARRPACGRPASGGRRRLPRPRTPGRPEGRSPRSHDPRLVVGPVAVAQHSLVELPGGESG